MTNFANKEFLRNSMIQKRLALTKPEIEAASLQLYNNFFNMLAETQVKSVFAFMPFRNEINVVYIIEELLKQNKHIVLPRVDKDTRTLSIFTVTNLANQLEEGSWGIKEPYADLPKATPEEIDLILVPGVAFDKRGFRLGYGGGFYDRFLGRYQGKTVGVGYDFQIVQEVPTDNWDVPLDVVLTDKACYKRGESNV